MINQFWNLCRACPSVNIDKLHSEYRSTYRWHEYTPHSQHEVIRKPPASQGGVGSGMQESGDTEHHVRVSQSEERSRRLLQPSHRSRSEGPLGRDLDDDSFLVSEYKTQYAWVRRPPSSRGPEAAPLLEAEKPPLNSTKNQVNINGVAGGASAGPAGVGVNDTGAVTDSQPAGDQQPRTPRKSKSMGRIHGGGAGPEVGGGGAAGGPAEASGGGTQQQHDQAPPATGPDTAAPTQHWHRGHRRTPSDGVAWRHSKGLEADRIVGGEMFGEDDKLSKRAYKSEYRKKFRPFSQYQYVDGKFHKVKGEETAAAGGSESPNNWYKEVIELRRQAGQYRARHDIGDVWRTVQHRGWGVETASERLAEIYSKQAELWEQVSRRSSLQALSLASASPSSRPISKAEKEIENSRRSSPIKHVSKTSRERPSTAPPKPKPASVHAQKAADKTDGKTSKESTPRHHYERTTASSEDGLLITSPSRDKLEPFIPDDWSSRRSARRTPPITSPVKGGRSVSVGPENRSPKRTSRPPSTHAPAPTTKPERRPRPSEENEVKKDKEKEIIPKDGPKDASLTSKEPVEALKESSVRKSTPEPRFDPEKYEPVVKTPPEPTRVKSPDQVMVKSPDPVNWTVPLDTGKTFTVTHNIPEGESARGTPSSEYRHTLESRTRQTPEPTKISQGSLVGTPVAAVSTEFKSQSQEQPKPTTATTVESKVDDKSLDKKPEVTTSQTSLQDTKTTEAKLPEDKPVAADTLSSKVDSDKKISETKEAVKPSDTKAADLKPSDTKAADVKPSDTKAADVKPSDTKAADVKPSDTKAADVKRVDSKVKEPISLQPEVPVIKPAEPKLPAVKPAEPLVPEPKPSEHVVPESKAVPETKKPEPIPEHKSFPAQPLQKVLQQQHVAPPSPSAPTQASPLDIIPPSGTVDPMTMSTVDPMTMSTVDPMTTSTVDPMTMSMFGSLNGMNGKSSGTPSPTKPEVPLPSTGSVKDGSTPESKPVGVRNVPGTNLRCLDDPSFMFDQPSTTTTNSPNPGSFKVLEAPAEPVQPKSGGYRVLEAPEAPSDIKDLPDQSPTKPEAPIKPTPYRVLEAPIEPPTRPKGSPYRVLEAPDAPYYPQTQTVGSTQESKPPSLVSPSSGRTVTDALDKARTRFDSYWGGPKDKDPPSKV